MMSVRFAERVVLVAGGTGGLGRAVSLAFLEEAARVIVTYRNPGEFAALQSAAGASGSSHEGQRVDVTDEAATHEFVKAVLAKHGHLDVLVNTVGGYAGGAKLWESDTKVFDQMLAVNLRPGLILSRAVVPAMLEAKHGAIVNVASKAAVDHAGVASAYAASKAAALALIDSPA